MRRKQLRLEQQREEQEAVKRDGRNTRDELPLGLLFSLLGNDQLHFTGAENVRADQVFRNVQWVLAHLRRRGAGRQDDALVHFRWLYRRRMVFLDVVGFAIHIAGHNYPRRNGFQRQIRWNRRVPVQLHDGQHGGHQRALVHDGGAAALCWRIHRRRWTSINRN